MDEPRPQRQHARIRSSKILVRIPTVDKLRAHYLRDLSEGGIFVKSERTLPIGTAVNIELVPPGWTASLILTGRVVRIATDEEARKTNAVGMAIRFEEVTPEAQQALTELIRKHSQSEALSAPLSGDEAERLRTQVQGLMFELSAARESLQACERDRDAQAARVPAGGSPSGPADDGGELVFLRAHLETANARVAKLQEELRRSEDDEAQSRALAERLAHEKRLLEKSQKEASRDTGEVERLRQELQDSEARFASERDRAEALKRRAYTADSELRAAQAQAKAERERSAQLERELEPLRGDLDRSRAKERDLRRLLSLVSSDAAEGSARPVELPSASAVPPREPEPSEPEVEVNEELEPMDPSEPAPETEEELPGPAYAQTPLTEALGVDSWGDAFDGAPADPLPLREETGVLISEPSKPILLTTPASSEEAAEVELGTFDDPEPVPLSHPVPPSPAPVEFPEFDRRLRAGTPLLRTQRFNMHTPTEPAEILVSAWLESADTLEGLQRLARGQLSEDRISKVVFQFYSRRLIDLPP